VGQITAGLTQMRQALAALRAMGAEILRPSLLALLAEACVRAGQIEAGLGVLEEAIVTAEEHTERFYAAELQRLKGEFVLRKGQEARANLTPRAICKGPAADGGGSSQSLPQTEAETCFQNALHIAQCQRAKLLELRAAMSLSRLWQQQGKRGAARQLLEEVYGWFTEGFETTDLQEAAVLLEELA
jgi:predicted ATPase